MCHPILVMLLAKGITWHKINYFENYVIPNKYPTSIIGGKKDVGHF
jgi:hypothetical protein